MEEHHECPRCDGDGSEEIDLTAEVMGREIGIRGVLTKTCEKCDGSGELHYTREATMDDLKDVQIKVLTEADIYRVSDGQTEEDVNNHGGPGGPTPSEAKARARSGNPNTSMPRGTPNMM